MAVALRQSSLKEAVFNHSKLIDSYVCVEHLIAELTNSRLEFLTPNELSNLYGTSGEQKRARLLLVYLKQQDNTALRKFLACLVVEKEHRGHQDICEAIMRDLPESEKLKVFKLVEQVVQDYSNAEEIRMQTCFKSFGKNPQEMLSCTNQCSNHCEESDSDCEKDSVIAIRPCPSRPPPSIILVGRLESRRFDQVDRKLWNYFSTGQYDDLEVLTERLQLRNSVDFRIIGMWFKALIAMHRDKNYSHCLMNILFPALELCDDEKTENPSILRGRILQRIAQVFLVLGNKAEARIHFERAEQELQYVGKCYETVNMHCRRAKLLSSTATSLKDRKEAEEEYSLALNTFTDDDAFALASRPSLILAKTAFHLHISFGARPDKDQPEPIVQAIEISKAESTLSVLSEDMLHLDMRQSERKLISAELERLKGNDKVALDSFNSIITEASEKNFQNLKAIAENRVHHMIQKQLEIDQLLEGLP